MIERVLQGQNILITSIGLLLGTLIMAGAAAPVAAIDSLHFERTSAVGTSTYRLEQDAWDILTIRRTGSTTDDHTPFTILNLISGVDEYGSSEATLSLTTLADSPDGKSHVLDVYNDGYPRDHTMGMRQLYRNTTANPIVFSFHDRTVNGGTTNYSGVNITSGQSVFSYETAVGVVPSKDDWVWDNANAYFADDTKILGVNSGTKTVTINRPAIGSGTDVTARSKNIKDAMRITPNRQLLVRKFIPGFTSSVAEFGGLVSVDKLHIKSSPPSSATAACTAGMVTWDANYVYVCVATNQWKRAALSTW